MHPALQRIPAVVKKNLIMSAGECSAPLTLWSRRLSPILRWNAQDTCGTPLERNLGRRKRLCERRPGHPVLGTASRRPVSDLTS